MFAHKQTHTKAYLRKSNVVSLCAVYSHLPYCPPNPIACKQRLMGCVSTNTGKENTQTHKHTLHSAPFKSLRRSTLRGT